MPGFDVSVLGDDPLDPGIRDRPHDLDGVPAVPAHQMVMPPARAIAPTEQLLSGWQPYVTDLTPVHEQS